MTHTRPSDPGNAEGPLVTGPQEQQKQQTPPHHITTDRTAAAQGMSRSERADLERLVRQQARVQKSLAAQRAAELVAELEQQLDRHYAFDSDEIWAQAYAKAKEAATQAKALVEQHCMELGLPKQFCPSISGPYWHDRGRNASKEERAEMRRIGKAEIEAMEKSARTEIDRAALELQTEIVAGALTSDTAKAFLGRIAEAQARVMLPVDLAKLPGFGKRTTDDESC